MRTGLTELQIIKLSPSQSEIKLRTISVAIAICVGHSQYSMFLTDNDSFHVNSWFNHEKYQLCGIILLERQRRGRYYQQITQSFNLQRDS